MIIRAIIALAFLIALAPSAHAKAVTQMQCGLFGCWAMPTVSARRFHHHRRTVHRRRHDIVISHESRHRHGIETIMTAAGPIKAAPAFGIKIRAFIAELVEDYGYHPKQVHCFAATGHMTNSLHHVGRACDFDQPGWDETAPEMRHVTALAAKWGLRDGCTFKHPRRDCGHIDDGSAMHRHHRHAYALAKQRVVPVRYSWSTTVVYQRRKRASLTF